MTYAEPLAPMMADVASELLGSPNERLSKPRENLLRYGSRGSFEVNTAEGWFADYEAGAKGGVLALVKHKTGAANDAEALKWLEDKGIKQPSEQAERKFYDYRDETGAVAYRVERCPAGSMQRFRQHGPDGMGGFVARSGVMQGVRPVPYRLPELIAADPGEIVFICEGEKDADRLAARGLIATTNPGGAGKWRADFAPLFAGRRVVVLEDNDDAGRKHAADVMAKVQGTAAEVAVLSLPGLPPKGDVSDWLNAGGKVADLQTLAAKALDGEGPDLLPSLDLAELAGVPAKPKVFVIPKIAPADEVTLFTGPGAAGKSLFLQQATTAFAAGAPLLGLNLAQGRAIYMTCEDDAEQLHWRQEHICQALGVPMASLAGKLRLVSLRGGLDNELATFAADGTIRPTAAFQRLSATMKADGARLVVLDNVAHLFTGNENDRGDVTRFINLLNGLAGETRAAIVLVGHPNKQGDEYSGSTGWINAVRSQVFLQRDRDSEGNVNDPDARVLSIGKPNYTQAGEALRFRWHNWAYILDDDLPADTRAEFAATIKANGENAAFLRCLKARNDQKRHVSEKPTAANFAPRQFEKMAEAKGTKRAAFERAMERLFAIGQIERGLLWRDTAEGKDIFGLREASGKLTGNLPETPSAESRKPAEIDRKHSVYSINTIPGAANGAAAPDDEEDGDPFDPRTWGDE